MIKEKIYQQTYRTVHSLKMIMLSFKIWPANKGLKFWLTFKREAIMPFKNTKFAIRTKNIFSKISDLSMISDCIIQDNYKTKQIRNGDTILDIGSNIGAFAIHIATKNRKTKIYAYEPCPENFQQLQKNLKLNKLKNITPINKAVLSKKGEIQFYIDKFNPAGSNIYQKTNQTTRIKSVTLTDIFKKHNIQRCNFLKMDCEGSEYEILLSTPREVLEKIDVIAAEYHLPRYFGLTKNCGVKELSRHLEKAGFTCKTKKSNRYQGLLFAKRIKR